MPEAPSLFSPAREVGCVCVVCGCVGPFTLFVIGVGWAFWGGVWEGHAQCLMTSISNILMVSVSYLLIWRGEKNHHKLTCFVVVCLFVVLILKAILSVSVCIFSLFLLLNLCLLRCQQSLSEWELLERVKEVSAMPRNIQQSSTDLTLLNADLMDMDFTDNLFSSLNQPFAFPNPRELGQSLHCSLNQLLCV